MQTIQKRFQKLVARKRLCFYKCFFKLENILLSKAKEDSLESWLTRRSLLYIFVCDYIVFSRIKEYLSFCTVYIFGKKRLGNIILFGEAAMWPISSVTFSHIPVRCSQTFPHIWVRYSEKFRYILEIFTCISETFLYISDRY